VTDTRQKIESELRCSWMASRSFFTSVNRRAKYVSKIREM